VVINQRQKKPTKGGLTLYRLVARGPHLRIPHYPVKQVGVVVKPALDVGEILPFIKAILKLNLGSS
jgi:hypothetical protein